MRVKNNPRVWPFVILILIVSRSTISQVSDLDTIRMKVDEALPSEVSFSAQVQVTGYEDFGDEASIPIYRRICNLKRNGENIFYEFKQLVPADNDWTVVLHTQHAFDGNTTKVLDFSNQDKGLLTGRVADDYEVSSFMGFDLDLLAAKVIDFPGTVSELLWLNSAELIETDEQDAVILIREIPQMENVYFRVYLDLTNNFLPRLIEEWVGDPDLNDDPGTLALSISNIQYGTIPGQPGRFWPKSFT